MQRTEMQRGNQRYEKMIGRQAAKEDHEPALRKTGNVEEADKHHTRNNKDEKYRQQPVEIDGCEINEPQNHYPQPERAPYLFSTGTTTISSRLLGAVLRCGTDGALLPQPRFGMGSRHRPRHTAIFRCMDGAPGQISAQISRCLARSKRRRSSSLGPIRAPSPRWATRSSPKRPPRRQKSRRCRATSA